MHDLQSGRLAHGWIFSGPRGIGKATLAYRFARTLLAGDDIAAQNRIAVGSHTDLLVLEPLYDEKKEEYAREISVEQAREVSQFLSLTPGEGKWRVVIIDSADMLNNNAANAILKILEEPPPQTLLLLISHQQSRLLPTIRSRCRMLKLKPLDQDQFVSVMRHVSPALEGKEIRALAQLSAMSPGVALELHTGECLELYEQILDLLSATPLDTSKIHAFADSMGSGKVHSNWQAFTQLVLFLMSRIVQVAENVEINDILFNEIKRVGQLAKIHPPAIWADKWQQVSEQFSLVSRLHLDYKQAIITFLHSVPSREGFHIGIAA